MEVILLYLLKAHLVASLLFAIYFLFLKNEFFLRLNRLILLGVILLAIALPVLPMVQMEFTTNLLQKTSAVNPLPRIIDHVAKPGNKEAVIQKNVNAERSDLNVTSSGEYMRLFMIAYEIVAGILLVRFIAQIYQVLRFVRRNKRISQEGLKYINPREPVAPFSFFHYIIINRNQYTGEQFRQIMTHEKAHTDQWHSIDILLTELLHIILWCNPLMKKFKDAVTLNLEYLADREVLNKGFDKAAYQRSIVHHLMNLQGYTLANSFHSKTKLRIQRMNEEYENRNLYKYLLIAPFVAAMYILINPLDAKALNRLNLHAFEGFYTLDNPDGYGVVAVKMVVKDDHLVMRTLWNAKEIRFEQQSDFKFINKDGSFPLEFSKTDYYPFNRSMRALNNDVWYKVAEKNYKPVPVKKGQQEEWRFVYDQNGGVHSAVSAVNPWDTVKDY